MSIKFRRILSVLLIMSLISISFVGCTSQTSTDNTNNNSNNTSNTDDTSNNTDDASDNNNESKPMTMVAGSASSGGSNYLLMAGWGEIINKYTNHRIVTEATGGPASNIELIGNGDAQIGVVAMSIALPAYNGTGWAEGKDFSMLRSMFGLHDALMDGVALAESGIKSIHDLNGKTVSVGPAGGTPALAVPDILNYYGITPKYVNLGQEDSVNALKDNQIDAAIFFGGIPRPSYQELAASHNPVRLGLSDEETLELVKELPQFSAAKIEAGTYSYTTEDYLTLKDRYAYAIHKDVPEDVVYELVKVTLEHLDEFKEVHKSIDILEVGDILLEGIYLPLHPGAIRALEEAGVVIPDYLIPQE